MKQDVGINTANLNTLSQYAHNSVSNRSEDAEICFEKARNNDAAGKYENAIQYYLKAVDLISANLTSEIEDHEIRDAAQKIYEIGKKYFNETEYAHAIAIYEKARDALLRTSSFFQENASDLIEEINLGIENASVLEADRLLNSRRYDDALKIFNTRLSFVEDDELALAVLRKRGDANDALEQYEESVRCYFQYLFLKDEIDETVLDRILNIGNGYAEKGKYEKAVEVYEKLYQFVRLFKPSREETDFQTADEDSPEIEVYKRYGKKVLTRLGNCQFDLNDYESALQSYLKVLKTFYQENNYEYIFAQINSIIDFHLKKKDEDKAFSICEKVVMLHPDKHILRKMMNIIDAKNKKAEQEKAQAVIAERNKIISNLSHIITNLIVSTVVDPLEVLKTEAPQSNIVLNALRGANLVNHIVRAMNLSYKGSKHDFKYDAFHNQGPDCLSLKEIIIQGLKSSVGNMYDGGYFKKFTDKYFPTDKIYLKSKEEWLALADSDDMRLIDPFLNKYFFKTEFDLAEAQNHIIGNEKNSAVKMLILIQEMILNAVKYAVYVKSDRRFLRISFTNHIEQISIQVENSFKSQLRTKRSGIGMVIINNFASLLDTEPIIAKTDTTFSMTIRFNNFWKR